jgi:hypothetical protein
MVCTTSTNSSLPFPLAPADKDRAGDLQANGSSRTSAIRQLTPPQGDQPKDIGTAELLSSALECLDIATNAADSGNQPFCRSVRYGGEAEANVGTD